MSWRVPSRRYPVLAIRDFRLLLVDRLLAPFSMGFSLVGVSFAVLKVTGSTAGLSYVIGAQTAPMLVFSLISGVFADRFRPQRVIMAGNLAVVVGEGVFGVLMLVTGVIGALFGVALGILAALRKGGWFDHITAAGALAVLMFEWWYYHRRTV